MELKNFGSSTKKVPFTSPYPPLVLSADEKQQLRQLGKTLLQVNVDDYETFLFDDNGKLAKSEWKLTRQDEQVETYVRRRDNYNLRGFGTTKRFHRRSGTDSSTSSSNEVVSSLDVADIRSIGSRDGTIEDVIYGAMSPTTETMRYKTAYVQDGIEDCTVLAIIENVTEDEPFTSLSIRRRVTKNPPILRNLLKSYEHLYLEATGFTYLSNGERIAYQFLHSVDFPSVTLPLRDYVRCQAGGIGLYRQSAPNIVEIHARTVFAVPSEGSRSLFVSAMAAAMSKSVMHSFFAGHMKKLRWALAERKTQSRPPSRSCTDQVCSVCNKKRAIYKGGNCDLCGKLVCSVCRITHKVASLEQDSLIHWTKVRVCQFCMTKVMNSDATEVIRGEIKAGWYDR